MIQKLITSFFLGFILFLLIDFLLFIGIKINYIDLYRIKVYYNTLFVDNQNYTVLIICSFAFGYLLTNKKSIKLFAFIYIFLILISLLTLYKPVGKKIAEIMFRQNNLSFKLGKVNFKGDLLYRGRYNTYIYRKDIDKIIRLNNQEFKIL